MNCLNCLIVTQTILLGDFNINWLNNSKKKTLKIITSKYKLHQMITSPTRITHTSKTLIDLTFTNKPERVTNIYNLLTGLSDYNLTLIVRKLSKQRFQNRFFGSRVNNSQIGIPKQKVFQFENELNNINWERIFQIDNLNDCCDFF